MTTELVLPTPGDPGSANVWGALVNDAITAVRDVADAAAAAASTDTQVDTPVTGITYDGALRLTGYTDPSGTYSAITYSGTTGLVTSYMLNGTTHVVSHDTNNNVTGVS